MTEKNSNFGQLFWTAGFMFTVGVGAIDFNPIIAGKWYEQIITLVLHYLLWPITLGTHFS